MKRNPSLNNLTAVYTHDWKRRSDDPTEVSPPKNFGRFHERPRGLSVHFDNIVPAIKDIASHCDVAIGAIAWFTNKELLAALASFKRVAVIVQKEDFLRQDTTEAKTDFRHRLRKQYEQLQPITSEDFSESYPGQQDEIDGLHHNIAPHLLSYKGLHVEGAVRALGYRHQSGTTTTPLMHHKFMIFGNYQPDHLMYPHCVVTGSFNWSANAERSRENIMVVYDVNVCSDYVSEWAQLWARSEPLDWDATEPEVQRHYIGT